jgi:hypothetical protein
MKASSSGTCQAGARGGTTNAAPSQINNAAVQRANAARLESRPSIGANATPAKHKPPFTAIIGIMAAAFALVPASPVKARPSPLSAGNVSIIPACE